MKTLEKDRNRRYNSPSALMTDIEHFLNDEAVTACPLSPQQRGESSPSVFDGIYRKMIRQILLGFTTIFDQSNSD